GSFIEVTDGIVMGAAAVVIITAGSGLKWAASPCKAVASILIDTATSIAFRAGVGLVTNRGRHNWGGW
uniref:hypothetical protein n=1 Tax=Escherichia coli TaxID=562 RepID=UPI00200E9033